MAEHSMKNVGSLVYAELLANGRCRVCNLARRIRLPYATVYNFLRERERYGYVCRDWMLWDLEPDFRRHLETLKRE